MVRNLSSLYEVIGSNINVTHIHTHTHTHTHIYIYIYIYIYKGKWYVSNVYAN